MKLLDVGVPVIAYNCVNFLFQCSDENYVMDRIQAKIVPLMLEVQKNSKGYTKEEKKRAKLSELKEIFDIARCPCYR